MNLTKGKINKLYNKKRQTLKRKINKKKSSNKSKTFRRNRKINLARKSLKRFHNKKYRGGIGEGEDTMENSYSIRLENEDYTIGKIIEFNFYDKYFINSKNLNYVSFLKKHPHDNFSIIKLSYKNQITKDDILLNYEECINTSILLINSIKEYFTSK